MLGRTMFAGLVTLVWLLSAGAGGAQNSLAAKSEYAGQLAEDRRNGGAYVALAGLYVAEGNTDEAAATVKQGLKYARQREDRIRLHTLAIDIEGMRGNLKAARAHFRKARSIRGGKKDAGVLVAMARVNLDDHELEDADKQLKQALALAGQDTAIAADAKVVLERLQNIEKALAVTDSQLAYVAGVTREQVAGHLIGHMQLHTALAESIADRNLDTASLGEASNMGLTDYEESVYRAQILKVHRMGLRSFRIRNGAFQPDRQVRRLELALLIEDILYERYRVSRTQYIGTPSPFSDLATSSTGFNAIMTAVTRGLMQGNQDGTIRPQEVVSGAEAVLVLHDLENLLNQPL